MKKAKNKKTGLVVVLLILVLLISVGYAALSTNLSITGNTTINKQSWSVYFNNVVLSPNNNVASVTTAPSVPEGSKTTTELNWEVSMDTPGQVYEFNVDVVNEGSLDAMIETEANNIVASELTLDQKKYLDYTITYSNGDPIEQYDKLAAGETKTITVKLLFKQDVDPEDLPTTNQTGISLSYTTNYVQADNNAVEKDTSEGISISLVEEKQNVTVTAGGNVKEVTSDGVPIPQGFYYVGGTIDEGVVVSDNANDANKGTSFATAQTLQGNQFVWVPVRTSKIKTDIKSGNEIASIEVKDSSNKNTYNLDANNEKTYNQDFYPGRSETYTFTVTDTEGNTETKDITITNVNEPIYWNNNGQKVGQLWATSIGENFGTKNTGYTANSGLREPDILSSDSYNYDGNTTYLKTALGASTDAQLMSALGLTSLSNKTNNANAFKKILQKEFDQMITSVTEYGGFYVGRYETGGFNTSQCVVKPGQGNNSINNVNWYTMYNKTKTLSTESVTATLIWGCQYDAMCNWIDDPTRTKKSDDTRTSYSTLNTGSIASDVSKNIYDLAGNVVEWTMEAIYDYGRVLRGGGFYNAYSVSYRSYDTPVCSYVYFGGRSALFIL